MGYICPSRSGHHVCSIILLLMCLLFAHMQVIHGGY